MKTELEASRNGSSHPVSQSCGCCLQNHEETAPSSALSLHIREILVPTDFSEHSNFALRYAMPLARQFDARITLLHVIEPASVPSDGLYLGSATDHLIPVAEHEIACIWEREKAIRPPAWRSIVGEGVPSEVILRTAAAEKTDLIIIATHGRTGLARVFLGSTAERVIRQAPCPVLVVRVEPREIDQQHNKN